MPLDRRLRPQLETMEGRSLLSSGLSSAHFSHVVQSVAPHKGHKPTSLAGDLRGSTFSMVSSSDTGRTERVVGDGDCGHARSRGG